MLPCTSKDLIASSNFKQVFRVTRSDRTFCLKRSLFDSASERNFAYLRTGLQKLLIHPNICRVKRRAIGEEQLHLLEVETEWGGDSVAELAKRKQEAGECWADDTLHFLLTTMSHALAYAHSMHIPHSHLCPTNLFQDPNDPYLFRLDDFAYGLERELLQMQSTEYFSPQRQEYFLRKFVDSQSQLEGTWDPYKDDVYALGLILVGLASSNSDGKTETMLTSLPIGLQPLVTSMLAHAEADRPSALVLAQQAQLAQDRYLLDTANNSVQVSSEEHIRSAVWCLCRISRPVLAHCVTKARKIVSLSGVKREWCCLKCEVECEFGYVLHCRKHVVCLDHAQSKRQKPCLWQLCWVCGEPDYKELPMSMIKNTVDKAVVFKRVGDAFVTVGRTTIDELLRGNCHWCKSPLLEDSLYVPHNSVPAFLCSQNCPVLQGSKDDSCSVCSAPANQFSLQQVLSLPNPSAILFTDRKGICGLCRYRNTSIQFECNCQVCEQCLRENYQCISATHFPCIRCGMMLQVAEYSQLLRRLALID